ncbi:putative zinc-binding oxidoreductase ToxD [Rhizodiscina lignyota]|uniref:Zinc-binding oxidoreductase ToxD n=1 Tax=Rhizodiscina lignyota TaxID=1504668 RepID=A0A9P4IBX7_9PEZI|nr:putative zinc-binding oxidoreductase ToxD [Rhizodiscina lignyota]
MKALKEVEGHKAAVVEVPKPRLRPDYILIKTKAVALNPTDWKHIDKMADPGTTIGCDCAGIVEEIGPEVTKKFKKGDRVASFTHGGNNIEPEDGGFAEYFVGKGDIVFHIPDFMSFEDAATLPVAIITCGQGLYQHMGLPWPDKPLKEKRYLLVYGGSTGTGMAAIQYAKLSGFDVLVTCSPRNFDLVKSLGASKAYDYKSPTCAEDIRRDTDNQLFYAFDCISEGSSPGICAGALSTGKAPEGEPPRYGAILRVKDFPRDDVTQTYNLGYTCTGEKFVFRGGVEWAANKDDFEFAKKWFTFNETLLAEKKIKGHRPSLRDGGLDKILEGLDDVRTGKVSGEKIVYTIA